MLHNAGAEWSKALNGFHALSKKTRRLSVLQDQFALALGEAGIHIVANVGRHRAFVEDLRLLMLDIAVTTRRLESCFEVGIPYLVITYFMPGECQLVAKLGFAFGTEAHHRAEFCFAGEIAHRIVLFAFEIIQRNRFCRLRQVILGDNLFLMYGLLKWSGRS